MAVRGGRGQLGEPGPEDEAALHVASDETVVLEGDTFDDARARGLALAEERGLTVVHPYDDLAVAAGQGTIALEMLAAQPTIDTLVVAIGGGGCRSDDGEDRFPSLARELSNCPSGAEGGVLGWLQAQDCAPEFAREVFDQSEIGVLPRLVHSRFGLHVVEVLARQPGTLLPYESARGAVTQMLQQQSYVTAVRQYLQLLAGSADIRGVDLDAADSPLVQ